MRWYRYVYINIYIYYVSAGSLHCGLVLPLVVFRERFPWLPLHEIFGPVPGQSCHAAMNPDLGNGPGIASSALQEPWAISVDFPRAPEALGLWNFLVWKLLEHHFKKKKLRRMYAFYMLWIFEAMGKKYIRGGFFLKGTNKLGVFPPPSKSKGWSITAVWPNFNWKH